MPSVCVKMWAALILRVKDPCNVGSLLTLKSEKALKKKSSYHRLHLRWDRQECSARVSNHIAATSLSTVGFRRTELYKELIYLNRVLRPLHQHSAARYQTKHHLIYTSPSPSQSPLQLRGLWDSAGFPAQRLQGKGRRRKRSWFRDMLHSVFFDVWRSYFPHLRYKNETEMLTTLLSWAIKHQLHLKTKHYLYPTCSCLLAFLL